VIEENGGAGARAAAPIARKVLDAYLLGPDGKLKASDSPKDVPVSLLSKDRIDVQKTRIETLQAAARLQ
jgi:penicillin-binding protein 2